MNEPQTLVDCEPNPVLQHVWNEYVSLAENPTEQGDDEVVESSEDSAE